jgi:hypothetical protein
MKYGKEGYLTNLRFADDLLLVGRSLFQVREMLSDLMEEASKVGLLIHPSKTKILNNGIGNGQTQQSVVVGGRSIDILKRQGSTMYLGRLLNLLEPTDTEINFRIKRAWAKFAIFKKELTDKDYSLYQRMRLFHAVVTPTVLYGSGTWAMTASRDQALRTTQRKMLRSILGCGRKPAESSSDSSLSLELVEEEINEYEVLESWVQWKRRTTREALDILEKIGIPDWADEQRRRLWRWAGHLARRRDGRWITQVVYWAPHEARPS